MTRWETHLCRLSVGNICEWSGMGSESGDQKIGLCAAEVQAGHLQSVFGGKI